MAAIFLDYDGNGNLDLVIGNEFKDPNTGTAYPSACSAAGVTGPSRT